MDNSLGLYVVGGFLLINLLLGLWAGRGVKDIRDYAVGNKRWGSGALVMTYLATNFGGSLLFRQSITFFDDGLIFLISYLTIPLSELFIGKVLSKNFNKFSNCLSLGDCLEQIYGTNSKIVVGILSFIQAFLISSIQIKSLAMIFEIFFNIEGSYGLLMSGAIIVLYTVFGGIQSVTVTDLLQFILMLLSLFLMSNLMITKAGGLSSIFKNMDPSKFEMINNKNFSNHLGYIAMNAVFFTTIFQPQRFHRFLMCRDSKQLIRMTAFSALGGATIILMLAFMAFAASTIYPDKSSSFIVEIYNQLVPYNIRPIVAIGFLSFVFSTGDSVIHVAGLSLYNDVLKPVFKIKEEKLRDVKILTAIIGMSATFLAYYNILYVKYTTAILLPIVSASLFGLLGMKTGKKAFWLSLFATFFSIVSLESGLIGEIGKKYVLLISVVVNFLVYIMVNIYMHGDLSFNEGLYKINSSIAKKFVKPIRNILKFIFNLNDSCQLHNKIFGENYLSFGIFYLLTIMIPYIFWAESFDATVDFMNLLNLRIFGIIFCGLLIGNSIWPSALKKYRPSFWYLTLTYCLPFLSTIMLILSHGAIEYTINVAINIMFLLLLVDWASAIGIGLVGTAAAIGYYKFFIQADPTETIIGFETKYLLIYQIIFGTIIGLLFARKKHIRIKSLDENTDFLEELQQNIIETNNMSIAIADDANSTPENINLNPTENLEAVKSLLQEKNLLSSEMSQKLAELEIFIQAEEKNISPYMVLNAAKVDLLKISEKFESFSKACACENSYVSIYSKEKTVKWDSSQIIKCIGKLAQNYRDKMKNFYDEDSDIFLNITLTDERVKYISAIDPTIYREISAIGIVLSENENFYSNLKNKNFEKVMTDPEKIPSTRLKDHNMIDIERTIDAHYGVLQTIEDEECLSYICVLPINVYDIRPITLDLNSPNVKNLSYNWPAAEKLEVDFWEKASSINTISTNKIKKAIDYIKIYHRHQTRKSGEPYYLHPMSVAMIAIDIAQQNSEIHGFLMENIETIILVALLHDILEDTYIKHKNILQNFGGEVLRYIESVTKTNFKQREFLLSNDLAFTKLINQEPITICVKIADRIHNLYTIDGHPKVDKRVAIAEETIMFFTRAAKKYGMTKLAEKLTSMCNYIIKNEKLEGYKE